MTTVHTLASGSSGNALLVSCGATHLLVDAGISCRRITTSLAALVIAALAAHGRSEISNVQYIERGYEDIVSKLRAIGADIRAVEESEEHEVSASAG